MNDNSKLTIKYNYKLSEANHFVSTKKFLNNLYDINHAIVEFNNQLNNYDYGIIVNGKKYTNNINFSQYTTINPNTFERYKCGTCWDYTEYEAKVFKQQFHFDFTLNALKHDKEFSLYYMEIADNKKCPTHTWLAYRNRGKIYLFESSWKSKTGITRYDTEKEMIHDYINKHRIQNHDKSNPIIVTKYKPHRTFGLTPGEFMRRCIDNGKVIYFEINSISVDK